MDIILVHLGPDVPSYLFNCIKQIRNVCDNRIILAFSEKKNFVVREENVMTVHLDSVPKCDTWNDFKSDHFDKMGLPLWRYSCERFYAIETVMENLGIENALHIENDNLIYAEPDTEFLEHHCGKSIGLTQITETLIGAGIMYIGSLGALHLMNRLINDLIAKGQEELTRLYGGEMLNEMRLLKIIKDENKGIIKLLPIFPIEGSMYVYDCASWGQFIGGTFQNHGVSYHDDSHLIGRELNKGKWCVDKTFSADGRVHFVVGLRKQLFNLHIHSKQLEKWMSK
jgi:hypothetical protein